MASVFRSAIISVSLALITDTIFAQVADFHQQEHEFAHLYNLAYKWSGKSDDSLSFYSGKFSQEFTDFIRKNPETIHYPFSELTGEGGFYVQTSEDGKFRLYSWDTWKGGTWRQFEQIYQIETNGEISLLIPAGGADEKESNGFCSSVFTVNILGRPVYFTVINYVFSTADARQAVFGYDIHDGIVESIGLFRDKGGTHRQIYVDFNFMSVADRPERPVGLISYNKSENTITIELADKKGNIKNEKAVYRLQRNYFMLQ